MNLINEGVQVRVEFEDWVNKSLPRYQLIIYTNEEKEVWPTLYAPGVGVQAMLAHFFPWADFAVDEDEYEEGAVAEWEAECYSYHDAESGETFYDQEFEEWYKPPTGLVPVSDNGETATYVLILSLNEFGNSFLLIDDYLSDPDAQEAIGFTIE